MRFAVAITSQGNVPVVIGRDGELHRLDDSAPSDGSGLLAVIDRPGGLTSRSTTQGASSGDAVEALGFGVPIPHPGKVVGIGLNFTAHARDLDAKRPPLPTVFFKERHTLIGPGDPIHLPVQSTRVTAEAELGLVVGRAARSVSTEEALDYVAGFCCVLDQTAEDILRQDARLLTLAKNFPSFFSFGPEVVSLDELLAAAGSLEDVEISTFRNDECVATGRVANMLTSPAELVAFLSQVMPLEPGDVISTGTPGAVVLSPGDRIECRVTGLRPLTNTVAGVTSP